MTSTEATVVSAVLRVMNLDAAPASWSGEKLITPPDEPTCAEREPCTISAMDPDRPRLDSIGSGEQFKNLRIVEEVGQGAFGTVYRADDTVLGRRVALKVVPSGSRSRGDADRVLNEARLVASLQHPNVVALHQLHELVDGWAIEMEYVDGMTLRERMAIGKLDHRAVLDCVSQLVDGLAAAHEAGIVHGDIKPDNVMFTSRGCLKLTDFGLGLNMAEVQLRTGDGIRGTPLYMAPELLREEPLTPASDVWAVGLVAYELVAGEHPIKASTLRSVFLEILHGAPLDPPREADATLRAILWTSLHRDPLERAASASDLASTMRRPSQVKPAAGRRESSGVFVGRQSDLEKITALLGALDTGAKTAVIRAEAGMGKSALVGAVVRLAAGLNFAAIQPRPSLADVRSRLREVLSGGAGPVESRSVGRDGFECVAGLREVRGHVLVVLEDVHQLSKPERHFVRSLMQDLSNHPILFILTERPGSGPSSALCEWDPPPILIELAGLSAHESLNLLRAEFDVEAVHPALAADLIEQAAGHPLYLLQVAHLAVERKEISIRANELCPARTWDPSLVPSGLRQTVHARLADLEPRAREVVEFASVDGLQIDSAGLSQILGLPLLEVLRLLQRTSDGGGLLHGHRGGYVFRHALVQESVREALPDTLRLEIHRAFAEHLARIKSAESERHGTHWLLAGQSERAQPLLARAALEAARRQEIHRTVRLMRAAALVPGQVAAGTAYQYRRLMLRASHAFADAGNYAGLEETFDAILKRALEEGDTLTRWIGEVERTSIRYYRNGASSIEPDVMEAALRALPPGRELGLAAYLLGVRAKRLGDLQAAESYLSMAHDMYAAHDLDEQRSSALDQLASVHLRRGNAPQAEQLYWSASRMALAAGTRTNGIASAINAILARSTLGARIEDVEDLAKQVRRLELEGAVIQSAHAQLALAELRARVGQLEMSLRTHRAAHAKLEASPYAAALIDGLVGHASCLLARGDVRDSDEVLAAAKETVAEAGDAAGRSRIAIHVALRELWVGDPDRAREAFVELIRASRDLEPRLTIELFQALSLAVAAGTRDVRQMLAEAPRETMRHVRQSAAWRLIRAWLAADSGLVDRVQVWLRRSRSQGATDELDRVVIERLIESRVACSAGRLAAATQAARAGFQRASDCGHVWLQLTALRALAETATCEEQVAAICDALVLGPSEDADRIRRRWSVK